MIIEGGKTNEGKCWRTHAEKKKRKKSPDIVIVSATHPTRHPGSAQLDLVGPPPLKS